MANIRDDKNNEYIQHIANSTVKDVEINGELKKSFIAYAMAVNVSRASPFTDVFFTQ